MNLQATPGPEPARPLEALIDECRIGGLQIRVVLLCTLVAISEGIDLTIVPLLSPAIARDWALDTAAFSAIFSALPVGLIVGGFSVGFFSDRYGRRPALIGAMLLMSLSTFATVFVTTVPQLLVCRVLTGIGFGGVVPVTSTFVSEYLSTRIRPTVVAFVILGQSLGGLLASLLMKTELGQLDWQLVIALAGALCAFTTVLLLFLLPESPRYLLVRHPDSARLRGLLDRLGISGTPTPAQAGSPPGLSLFKALFSDGRAAGTALLWAVFIGVCAPVSFFANWLTLIYTHADKAASTGVSAAAAYWAGSIVGGLVLPPFSARWHVNKVLMATILGAAVFTVLQGLALSQGDTLNLAMAFACGVFISGAFYLLYPPAVQFYPTAIRSTGVGAAVAFGRIGNTLSPAIAGALLALGLRPGIVFVAMAAPLLLSFAAMTVFHRRFGLAPSAESTL